MFFTRWAILNCKKESASILNCTFKRFWDKNIKVFLTSTPNKWFSFSRSYSHVWLSFVRRLDAQAYAALASFSPKPVPHYPLLETVPIICEDILNTISNLIHNCVFLNYNKARPHWFAWGYHFWKDRHLWLEMLGLEGRPTFFHRQHKAFLTFYYFNWNYISCSVVPAVWKMFCCQKKSYICFCHKSALPSICFTLTNFYTIIFREIFQTSSAELTEFCGRQKRYFVLADDALLYGKNPERYETGGVGH